MKIFSFLFLILSLGIVSVIPISEESFAEEQIPNWIKTIFSWYAEDLISENELLESIRYLIENQIIFIDLDSIDIPERSKFSVGGAVSRSIQPTADYTVLVYVVGSDLESEYYLATEDLDEMIDGFPGDSINVIVETGGAPAEIDDYRYVDFTTVKRHEIKNDIIEISDLGQQNMGDPKTLTDFLVWGTSSYPANNYALILWNHGSGINGYGHDDVSFDFLSLDEIDDALNSAKKLNDVHYEMIGFDACLMATIEVANIVKDYGNYLVASEEIEVGYGWKYDEIISSLNENPKQTGAELGQVIADSFFADTIEKSPSDMDLSRLTTLSVIDLTKIPSLNESINLLTSEIETNISKNDMPRFSVSLRDTERYGVISKGEDSGHMDIKHFTENISEYLPQFKSQSDRVQQAVDDSVIYKVNGAARTQANGLSIYMPVTSDAVSTTYRSSSSSTNQFYSNYLDQDTIAPTQNLQIINRTISGTYTGDDVYEIKSYFTTQKNTDGLIQIIATDEFDPDESEYGFSYGQVNFTWDKYLPSLCVNNYDTCVPVNPEWEWGDEANLAYIPVNLESDGVKIDVDLLYDITIDDGEIFIGAYPQNEKNAFDKNLLSLKPDDIVTVYNEINHFDSKQSLFIPNSENQITVSDDFGFVWEIYEGVFFIVIEICDFSGNCSYSDFFEFVVTEDDLED